MVITEEMRRVAQKICQRIRTSCSEAAMEDPSLDADEMFNDEQMLTDLLGDAIYDVANDLDGRLAVIAALKLTENFSAWDNALVILENNFRRQNGEK